MGNGGHALTSVVIAAHNEETVLGRCLDALLAQQPVQSLEIVVSANGCTDATADVARGRGVLVVDRPVPGKTAALNAGDDAVGSFPRIYLDADIVLAPDAVARLVAALDQAPHACVAVPSRRVDTSGSSAPVRSYFAINNELPVFRDALFGRGTICVSEQGRARFDRFPEVIADDLFLDSLFSPEERVVVPEVEVVVAAPATGRDLVARLVRVRRGNAELRAAGAGPSLRAADRWAWWTSVVRPQPRLAPAAVPYVGISLLAAGLARRGSANWGRDESTRGGGRE